MTPRREEVPKAVLKARDPQDQILRDEPHRYENVRADGGGPGICGGCLLPRREHYARFGRVPGRKCRPCEGRGFRLRPSVRYHSPVKCGRCKGSGREGVTARGK